METKSTTPTPERIMQFFFGFAPTLVIHAAVSQHVFDILDEGPRTVEDVSASTGASVRGLRTLMNALVGLEFLVKDGLGRYSLTPESAEFLVAGRPGFHGGLFRHVCGQLLPNWVKLNEIVRTGRPESVMNQEDGGGAFFEEFVESIFPMSRPAAQVLADVMGLTWAKEEPVSVLDIAAGSGVWGITLAQKWPRMRVTAVDWAKVIPVTRRVAERFGVAERFSFVEGDILEAQYGHGHDIATLGHILHSEGERRGRALIRKVYESLAPEGTIVIADFLVNEERTGPPPSLLFAVNMLVHTDHGDTFSFGEISDWLREAGFKDVRTVEAPGPSPLILAAKPEEGRS
ncbi:MAG: methyltransferase [Peptococcaceae bacterium]|jgi:precorrin-6B methylase 2|nr:methyltransferase [Peptococcaceae bacterium]